MTTQILCGIDGQEPSIRAARGAFDLTMQLGAELTICMVNPVVPGRGAVIHQWPEEHIDRVLDEAVRQAKWAGVFKVKSETWHAISVADSLVGYADVQDVDYIVVGASDRPGIVKTLSGSVSRELIAKANCPVLVVRRLREHVNPTRRRQREKDAQSEPAPTFGYAH
jgi:nucleotide-binding universal stress UspA family protein